MTDPKSLAGELGFQSSDPVSPYSHTTDITSLAVTLRKVRDVQITETNIASLFRTLRAESDQDEIAYGRIGFQSSDPAIQYPFFKPRPHLANQVILILALRDRIR